MTKVVTGGLRINEFQLYYSNMLIKFRIDTLRIFSVIVLNAVFRGPPH